MKNARIFALATLSFFMLSLAASAQMAWDKKYNKKNIDFIVLTGNYLESKLLAEATQEITRQPVMLVDINAGAKRSFLQGPDGQALEISDSKFTDFINFAHPKAVIILGDNRYTPARYKALINKSIKVYHITDKSWEKAAWRLQAIMGGRGIADLYIPRLKEFQKRGIVEKHDK